MILISDLWTGIKPVLFKGESDPTGMPAFFNTFKALNFDSRVSGVECYFFAKKGVDSDEVSLPTEFRDKTSVNVIYYHSRLNLLYGLVKLVLVLSFRLMIGGNKKYTLYGHGAIGSLAGIVSILTGVKNTRRVYGTFLVELLHLSNFKMFLRHPLAFAAFKLPHKNLIVTNDGTHGDRVYERICGPDTRKLKYLVNGVDKLEISDRSAKENIISYVARLDKWKQQSLAIEAFSKSDYLKNNYRLVIAGPVYDSDYECRLKEMTSQLGIDCCVEFRGALTKDQVRELLSSSQITLSLYETSNFGNVLIEALQAGVAIVTRNINDSLAFVPENAYIDVGEYNAISVSMCIENVLKNQENIDTVEQNAREFCENNFLSWHERAKLELDIVLGH